MMIIHWFMLKTILFESDLFLDPGDSSGSLEPVRHCYFGVQGRSEITHVFAQWKSSATSIILCKVKVAGSQFIS